MDGPHLECLPDEHLAKKLGHTAKKITHHNDKGRVCKHLKENSNVIGMVDQDPNSAQPSYIATLEQIDSKHNVLVLKDKERGNRLVVLCPKLEDWLIGVCKANSIDITGFGLSNKANELHREINGKLKNLEKLLDHLIENKVEAIMYLRSVLKK